MAILQISISKRHREVWAVQRMLSDTRFRNTEFAVLVRRGPLNQTLVSLLTSSNAMRVEYICDEEEVGAETLPSHTKSFWSLEVKCSFLGNGIRGQGERGRRV